MSQEQLPQIANSVDAYAQYILGWAIRKEFRKVCDVCNGTKKVNSLVVIGSKIPCRYCLSSGVELRNFGEQLALVHSELSEMLEAHRSGVAEKPDEKCPDFTRVEIEAADVIIRMLDLAAAQNWRLGPAVEAKMAFNETRPIRHNKLY
jgi:hypothetical protein